VAETGTPAIGARDVRFGEAELPRQRYRPPARPIRRRLLHSDVRRAIATDHTWPPAGSDLLQTLWKNGLIDEPAAWPQDLRYFRGERSVRFLTLKGEKRSFKSASNGHGVEGRQGRPTLAVLAYLSRYTHRVAISNRRLLAFNETGVTFRYKDYRRDGADRQRVMTLGTDEFIRRFLLHLLPRGFHRIRHYGLLSASARKASLMRARELLAVAPPPDDDLTAEPIDAHTACPYCGGHMIIIETFARWSQPRAPPHRPDPTGRTPS
jgi:Putative transposase